jgi:hypothetical protein
MDGLTEGRIVHYVSYNGKHQAAIVTGTYTTGAPIADLAVFWNIEDTASVRTGGLSFHFRVQHSPTAEPGTWHWPNQGEAGH